MLREIAPAVSSRLFLPRAEILYAENHEAKRTRKIERGKKKREHEVDPCTIAFVTVAPRESQ